MSASAGIGVSAPAATATASTPPPSIGVAVPVTAATAIGSAAPPMVIIGPSAVLAYFTIPAPHPHLLADHHNPVAYGIELGLTVAVLFVGGKLVAARILGR
jgi:hypothetical protein